MPFGSAPVFGFQEGDILLSVDGVSIRTFNDVVERVRRSEGRPIEFVALRGDARVGPDRRRSGLVC